MNFFPIFLIREKVLGVSEKNKSYQKNNRVYSEVIELILITIIAIWIIFFIFKFLFYDFLFFLFFFVLLKKKKIDYFLPIIVLT